ncbi:MAG: preprotein translocase subunit SecG [Gammaproteobacteria bacterium]|nr:preprotein translocase subunit SecG [Gammaproteobacteria bacterium]
MLYSILVAVDVLLAIGIIGLVLVQHGKGADVGAAFGSGASGTVFGARGSSTFLTRATAILATLFFANSLLLAYLATHRPVTESVIDQSVQVIEEVVEMPVEESPEEAQVIPESTVSDLPDVPQVGAPVSDPDTN